VVVSWPLKMSFAAVARSVGQRMRRKASVISAVRKRRVPDLLTVAMVLVRNADDVDPLLMAKLPKFARPLELTPTSVEVGDIVLDPEVKQLTQVR
jgi:hypothetical protein